MFSLICRSLFFMSIWMLTASNHPQVPETPLGPEAQAQANWILEPMHFAASL
ncbi:hypothetical protein [Pelagimonas varians]|uniref:Uncharacterized protein n=1 Tax=Pelagimonas varians TaxID=696760 RepID=A0A238KD88_9RHOB|nr:hypothetical protein [Pelagimonas varians]PYG29901.1 hypothetical protein C8N36_10767 [Pelagimonas varians]SMX40818.1 hypothetical protein PEV8663_02128 [Pelagimonas varians]